MSPRPRLRPLHPWCPAVLLVLGGLAAQQGGSDPAPRRFGDYFEPDFPFLGSTLDGRGLGAPFPRRNLTPRGLILRAGPAGYACFDTDLLRIAAVWIGAGITEVGMAAGSYHVPGRKAAAGQESLPAPVGRILIATGNHPGFAPPLRDQDFADPRPPAPDPDEPGRGPLGVDRGRFEAIEVSREGAVVVYRVGGTTVREAWSAAAAAPRVLWRTLAIGPRPHRLRHLLAQVEGTPVPGGTDRQVTLRLGPDRVTGIRLHAPPGTARLCREAGAVLLEVEPGRAPVTLRLALSEDPGGDDRAAPELPGSGGGRRWGATVTTAGASSVAVPVAGEAAGAGPAAWAVDRLPLPLPNPWRRNVRAAGIDFLDGDTAALVTFDGDVWLVSGLSEVAQLRWRRFAAGLHEPQALRVVSGAILVFCRTGILRLRDLDRNGEADRYENFCNLFAQSAETREFAMDLECHPDGSLWIAKGGQQVGTASRHGGTILRIAADGRDFTRIARGLREPFLAVHPQTGRVTASDQQGNWVPTTPVLSVSPGDDFGFRDPARRLGPGEAKLRAPAPTRPPLCWIPHAACKSASGQVWAVGADLGPLNGRLLQLTYYDPGITAVFGAARDRPGSVATLRLPVRLDFPPLDGRIHPRDGSLYLCGFRIWGTESSAVSGVARLRRTGAPAGLVDVSVFGPGVLLCFDEPLEPAVATAAGSYVVQRWSYRRSHRYGSGHFRGDGSPGHDALRVSGVHLSADRRRVFLRVDDLRPVMQMAVRFALRGADGAPREGEAHCTVHELRGVDLGSLGLPAEPVPAAASGTGPVADVPASPRTGARLYATLGCAACHGADRRGTGIGPALVDIFRSERQLAGGAVKRATKEYLRKAIVAPAADVARGYQAVMPSYQGVLEPVQLESLLLFLQGAR